MPGVDRAQLDRVAGRNLGVFSRTEATACGYTPSQIRRLLACGDWQPVVGRAFARAGLVITPTVRDRAAQLSVPGSVLAGASAARVWRIRVPDERTFLYVGQRGRVRLPGVVAVHATPEPAEVSLYRGLPTVGPGCALIECLLRLPEAAAIDLLDRTLQGGAWGYEEFARRVETWRGRRGFHRLMAMRALVAGGERAGSERRLTALLRAAGVTGWRVNVPILDADGLIGVADVAFTKQRLVVEVDGWAYHSTPDRFQRDRERQNRLIRGGWRVLRFTWRDLTQRPDHVVAEVRSLLARS
jgi:very-short-patch-repair endonuclease